MRLVDADYILRLLPPEEMCARYVVANAPTIEPQQTCEYWDSESKFCALCRPSVQLAPCEFCKHNNIADDKACLMCSAERRERND